MKTRTSLAPLTSWILRHLNQRRQELDRLTNSGGIPIASEISFPMIDTHNAIATFMRAYCLSSLSGAYHADGRPVLRAKPIQGHRSALGFVMKTERPKSSTVGPWRQRDEPPWHDPRVIIRVLHSATCSNAGGVGAALSIGSSALEHLTVTRNFLAHRNESTALSLRRLGSHYGVGTPNDPLAVVFAVSPGRPQRIVEDWLDDLFTIFSLFPR